MVHPHRRRPVTNSAALAALGDWLLSKIDRQAWFAQHVLGHETALRGYLRRYLRENAEVADGVQETYARLLGLSEDELLAIRSVHAFLFTTARNVALDWLRKQRVVSLDLMAELESFDVLDEGPSIDEELNTRQELAMLAEVLATLPERCRQVLTLRKIYGLSQKEIAKQLGISENTVEKHVANGVRLCAARIYAARPDVATVHPNGWHRPALRKLHVRES